MAHGREKIGLCIESSAARGIHAVGCGGDLVCRVTADRLIAGKKPEGAHGYVNA